MLQKECKLQAAFPAASAQSSRECLAGAWFAFPETLVVFISCNAVPPFPAEAQKGFNSYLSRMADARIKQITVGMQF